MDVGQNIAPFGFLQECEHADDDQQRLHAFAQQDGDRGNEGGQRLGFVRPQFGIDLGK